MSERTSYGVYRDSFTGYWIGWFIGTGVKFSGAFDSEEEAMKKVSAEIKSYKENN